MDTHTISSNHFSTDTQAVDALAWMRLQHPRSYCAVMRTFSEMANPKWEGSWLDTAAMGVDVEYGSWLVEAIEATGVVAWEEGEPWALVPDTGTDEEEIAYARGALAHCEPERYSPCPCDTL